MDSAIQLLNNWGRCLYESAQSGTIPVKNFDLLLIRQVKSLHTLPFKTYGYAGPVQMKCGPVYVFVCSRICLDPCKRIEVVSHESGFARRRSPGLSRFARSHTTYYNRLCNKVNLLLRDVILVNLGVHMCAHYLSMLIPISQA